MKNLKFLILLLGFAGLLTLQSCKEDECPEPCQDPTNPDCENYDPCYGKVPLKASFRITQRTGGGVNYTYADTFPNGESYFQESAIFSRSGLFHFLADTIPGATYTWYLGSEVFNTWAFTRSISMDQEPGGRFEVKLVVEREPDLDCFPDDVGKDSLTKVFYLKNICDLTTAKTMRVFEPQLSTDSFDFKFYAFNNNFPEGDSCRYSYFTWTYNFYNEGKYIKGGGHALDSLIVANYSENRDLREPSAFIRIKPDGTIDFKSYRYIFESASSPIIIDEKEYHYKGRILNY
jgi:hypothetical protein